MNRTIHLSFLGKSEFPTFNVIYGYKFYDANFIKEGNKHNLNLTQTNSMSRWVWSKVNKQ